MDLCYVWLQYQPICHAIHSCGLNHSCHYLIDLYNEACPNQWAWSEVLPHWSNELIIWCWYHTYWEYPQIRKITGESFISVLTQSSIMWSLSSSSHSHHNYCHNFLLTHWGRDKMAAISQTTHSNAFSWTKMLEFRLKFHWSLFPRDQLTIFQHWFR